MRFVVPDHLLALLRARRAKDLDVQPAGRAARSLLGQIDLLSRSPGSDVGSAAADYVEGMRTLQREVEDAHDAFLLQPGMGPMGYLTSDGRVLWDGRSWDGEPLREASIDEAIATLVIGAKKTGIVALLDLIPACPEDGERCPRCEGGRWDAVLRPHGIEVICGVCFGRGWATPEMTRRAAKP